MVEARKIFLVIFLVFMEETYNSIGVIIPSNFSAQHVDTGLNKTLSFIQQIKPPSPDNDTVFPATTLSTPNTLSMPKLNNDTAYTGTNIITIETNNTNESILPASNSSSTETLDKEEYFNASHPLVHDPLVQRCRLYPTDPRISVTIADLLSENQAKLIRYAFSVVNYTDNPLIVLDPDSMTYKTNEWSRVDIGYGQTIINLAFNYEILSLMTLSFGVERMDIELQDEPAGCLSNLTTDELLMVVLDITMRDLKADQNYVGPLVVIEGQSSVCHQVIEKIGEYAVFTHRCCDHLPDFTDIKCTVVFPNKWLKTLDAMLAYYVIAVFIFGIRFVPGWMYSSALDSVNYVVKLKEPLYMNMAICSEKVSQGIMSRHTLDLRNTDEFYLCRRVTTVLPLNTVIPIKLSQYDVKVNYSKVLLENYVPVSLMECISKALFLCKLRELDAFKDCCDANLFGSYSILSQKRPWISCCKIVGRLMMVILLPFPFYIRLFLYYFFEQQEISERFEAANNLQLSVVYNYRLMQYLTPTHPVALIAYTLYMLVGLSIAYRGKNETRFQEAIVDSFADLKQMSWLTAARMFIRNVLYPFRRFGIFGIFVGPFIWPILIPLSAAVCFFYCIPIVFISFRIIYHIFNQSTSSKQKIIFKKRISSFEVENLISAFQNTSQRKIADSFECYWSNKTLFINISATIVTLLTIYSLLFIVTEVTGYLAEIVCFTMMGLIVNATKVIKYGSLVFLVGIYCHDTYNNVNKKYQKLNKALFCEIKSRIKGLNALTSLPTYLQTNTGFKATEASEQAEHESPDDLSRRPHYWEINDLILFVDSDDTPRIPKEIFDNSCQIKGTGSPGPVYQSLLQASGRFVIIIFFLMFVFIVVMSFGDVYKVSSTNQMLATLAGGFVPFILSSMLKPVSSDVETNLVSYKSKLEEIIQNFRQSWPMYDFVFNIEEQPTASDNEQNIPPTDTLDTNGIVSTIQCEDPNIHSTHTLGPNGALSSIQCEDSPNVKHSSDAHENAATMHCQDLSNPLVDFTDVLGVVESMQLKSAVGQFVDVVIILSEESLHPWIFDTTCSNESTLYMKSDNRKECDKQDGRKISDDSKSSVDRKTPDNRKTSDERKIPDKTKQDNRKKTGKKIPDDIKIQDDIKIEDDRNVLDYNWKMHILQMNLNRSPQSEETVLCASESQMGKETDSQPEGSQDDESSSKSSGQNFETPGSSSSNVFKLPD